MGGWGWGGIGGLFVPFLGDGEFHGDRSHGGLSRNVFEVRVRLGILCFGRGSRVMRDHSVLELSSDQFRSFFACFGASGFSGRQLFVSLWMFSVLGVFVGGDS